MPVNQEMLKTAQRLTVKSAEYDPKLHKMLQNWEQQGGSRSAYPMSANSEISPAALPEDVAKALARHLALPATQTPDELDAAETLLALESRLPQPQRKLANDQQNDDDDDDDEDDAQDNPKNERKQRAKNRAKDLLPMKGFGRGYADFLLPGTFGGTRAGRATMIAKALGQKPDFSVAHPNTDTALGSLGGMFMGGIPGALVGAGLGALSSGVDNVSADAMLSGALLGGGIGGGIGGAFGIAGAGMNRREKMREIQKSLADELEQHGTSRLKLKTPQYGRASSLLMPFSGAHRAGQADAYEALKNNSRYAKTPGRTAGYLASHIPYVGTLVSLGQGLGQNFSARKRLKQNRPQQTLTDRYGLEEFGAPKFANDRRLEDGTTTLTSGDKTMNPLSFGEKVGFFGQMNPAELSRVLQHPAALGGLGGATAGAVSGLIAPGEYEDADGNMKRRSRLGSALRRALMLGAGGAGAGMAYDYFSGPKYGVPGGLIGPPEKSKGLPASFNRAPNKQTSSGMSDYEKFKAYEKSMPAP